MWATIISSAVSVVLFVGKWLLERKAGRKLTDAEYVEHIVVHQKKRKGVARQANDFDTAMEELKKENENAESPNKL